jgi:hypothetical protein
VTVSFTSGVFGVYVNCATGGVEAIVGFTGGFRTNRIIRMPTMTKSAFSQFFISFPLSPSKGEDKDLIKYFGIMFYNNSHDD